MILALPFLITPLVVLALAFYFGSVPVIAAGLVFGLPFLIPLALLAYRRRRAPAPSAAEAVRAAYAMGRVTRERELLAQTLSAMDPLPDVRGQE